jgi:hypothetical protein
VLLHWGQQLLWRLLHQLAAVHLVAALVLPLLLLLLPGLQGLRVRGRHPHH